MFESDPGGTGACGCEFAREDATFAVSAEGCPGAGCLETEPACRAAVVRAIDGTVDSVRVVTDDTDRRYGERAVALLDAARRFADGVEGVDGSLAEQARRDPLGAARLATDRGTGTHVGRAAAESGLALCAGSVADDPEPYVAALAPEPTPRLPAATVCSRPPVGATFLDRRTLPTGAVARRYRTDAGPLYHLEPVEYRLDSASRTALADARARLVDAVDEERKAVERAASEAVAEYGGNADTDLLSSMLRRHTRGLGVVEQSPTEGYTERSIRNV